MKVATTFAPSIAELRLDYSVRSADEATVREALNAG